MAFGKHLFSTSVGPFQLTAYRFLLIVLFAVEIIKNKGKLYKLRGYEVPEAGRTARGTAIVNLLSLDAGEKVSAVIPIQNFAEGKYLLMATKNGLIKKTALSEYNSARKTGLQ